MIIFEIFENVQERDSDYSWHETRGILLCLTHDIAIKELKKLGENPDVVICENLTSYFLVDYFTLKKYAIREVNVIDN